MEKSLLYFLKELEDPYLLQQLLDLRNNGGTTTDIKEEIEENYGMETNINEIFNHFQNIPKDIKIKMDRVDDFDGDMEDITPDFEVKQQLLIIDVSGDTYLINLPFKIT